MRRCYAYLFNIFAIQFSTLKKETTLNLELYIARKVLKGTNNKTNISKPIINIAIFGVALGMAAMILSVCIVVGFKQSVRSKVTGFAAHIQVVNHDSNNSYETEPVPANLSELENITDIDGIELVQSYATKAGIIKSKNNVQGVVVKGVGSEYSWDFFKTCLIKGELPNITDSAKSNEVLVSETLAKKLMIDTGSRITTTFIPSKQGEHIRYRKFTVSGIYSSHLEEFDLRFIIGDIKHIQRLNNWKDGQVSGYEIKISDFERLDELTETVQDEIGYGFLPDGSKLQVVNIVEQYRAIFDWLSVLDMNVWVILVLMSLVAGMNMISGLLVIIIEKTNLIGLLKSFGAVNASVSKVFLYVGSISAGKGLLWGNVIGLGLAAIQYFWHIMPLDQETYFIDSVPIHFDFLLLFLLNAGSLLVTILMLIIPSRIISSVSPAETIKFE